MKRKYTILYIAMIVVSLFMTVAVSVFAHLGTLPKTFFTQILINIPFALLFGIVDLYIIRRNRIRNNVLRIVVNLVLTTSLALFLPSIINYFYTGFSSMREAIKDSILVVSWNWLVVLQIEIFHFYRKQIEMKKEKDLYQFEALKSQVNPHFLFNSLNVLSSLAYQDAEKTNLFAKKLSNVYRYLLTTHERPTVTLEEELSFVDAYIFLEQIRFGESLQIKIENEEEYKQKTIIPVSVQMLVENAIKHNISTQTHPLNIHIKIGADGIMVTNNLQIRSYVDSGGMGLNNLKKQYSLYNKEIGVTTTETEFIVHLPFIKP